MRTPLIVANWKMNKSIKESVQTVYDIQNSIADIINPIDIVICPAFTALYSIKNIITQKIIKLGAQNIFWENNGAFTGEISPLMLKDLDCSYVIVGHSERREYFKETDSDINKKILACLNSHIIPIICVGESLQNRLNNLTFSVIETQLERALNNVQITNEVTLVIAYEPIWAIGTGKTATSAQAQEVHSFIRHFCKNKYGNNTANKIRIIYGGSVNNENISYLMKESDIDGGLIGGASLQAQSFSLIIRSVK
jgi:triosephosphate isomerase